MKQQNIQYSGFRPIIQFIQKSTFSSILLFFTAFMALVLANTPAHGVIEQILGQKIGFSIGDFKVYKSLNLWINDGLMSIFFFVVGLELKREIIAGELSNPKNIVMPIMGAIGGMVLPACIYLAFNWSGDPAALKGWGIPMATDIAFALGVLYLLGPKVPIQLKVFLTALAIIDDLGAVIVVALFYTSELTISNLLIGAGILGVMFLLNRFGVRHVLIYAVLGIGGVWLAFLLSGVHATIAAVLAAFAIPATRAIDKEEYIRTLRNLKQDFEKAKSEEKDQYLLSADEENIIGEIRRISDEAISPLQRLEHSMHSFVLFIVMPIFALANGGVVIGANWLEMLTSKVSLGVIFGLVGGKFFGIMGMCLLGMKLGWFSMPNNMNLRMLSGVSLLAAIGFTMALFINSLAFEDPAYLEQAKLGILVGSLLAGTAGYLILKKSIREVSQS